MKRMIGFGRLLAIALLGPAAALAQQQIVDVRQGTDIAIAVSPDGQSLVIDLLGRLWRLPTSGGGAVPLTPTAEKARHPRYSPNGRLIVYQRFVGEHWDLWLVDLDTGARRALTDSPNDEREPDFLDDKSVVYASDLGGNYSLWAIDIDSGRSMQLTSDRGDASFPSVSDQGVIAYVRRDRDTWSLRTLSREAGNLELLSSNQPISAPSWRPGGGVIVFQQSDLTASSQLRMVLLSDVRVVKTLASGEDIYAVRPAWVSRAQYLYAADGQIWRRGIGEKRREPVHLFAGVAVDVPPAPQFRAEFDDTEPREAKGFSGSSLASDGRIEVLSALGDLWLASADGIEPLTSDPFVDADPALLPDGSAVVYSSDRGGIANLWLLDLKSRAPRQLTFGPGKAYRPAIDPSGRLVAFLETTGFGPWAPSTVKTLDIEDGTVLATSERSFENARTPIWVSTDTGAAIELSASMPGRATEREILELDANLKVRARRLPVATDADESMPQTHFGRLPQWRRDSPEGRYVIQAGRLFDGTRGTYRRHVDIHIEGHRIAAVVGRDVLPLPERVIDARERTVLPGFVDIHVHQSNLAGERLGRAWLANGVTTVREISADLAEAVARSEAWASARETGPHLLVSPASTLLMSTNQGVPSEVLAPALDRRLLSGPIHESNYENERIIGPLTGRTAELAPLAHDATSLDLRSSPLQAQYQDVYGTIIEAGFVTGTAIGAMKAFELPAGNGPRSSAYEAFRRFYTADEQTSWLGGSGTANQIRPRQASIARLIRSGARVAIGTDAPLVPYGVGYEAELELLAQAGIPNDQVLRVATVEGALALGLDREIGTVEAGKLADLIIVDGDPLERIADSAKIDAIVLGGRWLDVGALLSPP